MFAKTWEHSGNFAPGFSVNRASGCKPISSLVLRRHDGCFPLYRGMLDASRNAQDVFGAGLPGDAAVQICWRSGNWFHGII
jgi:hypothetical protein